MALNIAISKGDPGTYKVKLSGTLDTETAPLLDRRIAEVLADAYTRTVRLELQELTFISSIGLGSLAKIKKALAAKGGSMVTVGAQPQVARVFEIVKMLPKQSMFTSTEEADDYFAAIQKQVIDEIKQSKPD